MVLLLEVLITLKDVVKSCSCSFTGSQSFASALCTCWTLGVPTFPFNYFCWHFYFCIMGQSEINSWVISLLTTQLHGIPQPICNSLRPCDCDGPCQMECKEKCKLLGLTSETFCVVFHTFSFLVCGMNVDNLVGDLEV